MVTEAEAELAVSSTGVGVLGSGSDSCAVVGDRQALNLSGVPHATRWSGVCRGYVEDEDVVDALYGEGNASAVGEEGDLLNELLVSATRVGRRDGGYVASHPRIVNTPISQHEARPIG